MCVISFIYILACSPLVADNTFFWRCENNLPPDAVTVYKNCTTVCKTGFCPVNTVTARCSLDHKLKWIWFGDTSLPYCTEMSTGGLYRC